MVDFLTVVLSFGFFYCLRRVLSTMEGNKEDASIRKPIEMSDMGVGGGKPVYMPQGSYAKKNA